MDTIAAQITKLAQGLRTRSADADRIRELLEATPQGSLDAVLERVDLPHVVASMRGWRRRLPEAGVDLLTRDRVGELSHASLALVLAALHRGPTARYTQEAIVEVMTSLTSADFHDLKYRLNSVGDFHDLEHLVFEDLDEDLGEVLLEHIAEQADQDPSSDLRVLCDIDDTLKCAIHDKRYRKGTVYPGAVTLLNALDQGGAAEPNRAGDLTFVTARPSGPRGLIEQYTRDRLSGLGLPPHTVMGGAFLNLHTKNAMAQRKLQNMERDRLLFPEARMVFVGDSGQADGDVGAQMHARDPQHIVGTLLHNVTEMAGAEREDWAGRGVHVFDTYAGAAAHAVRLGLVNTGQAREVAQEVRLGLQVLDLSDAQRDRLERDLTADEDRITAAGTDDDPATPA
jgi:hypothetical protein